MNDPVEKLDRDWDALVARWDLEGTEDESILAAAEAELAHCENAEPVRAPSIDAVFAAIEAEARPMAPVLAMPAVRRWTQVAAAALIGMLLTAAVAVTIVWWVRQDYRTNLRFVDAVAILAEPNNDEVQQMAALMKLHEAVAYAAEALVTVKNDPNTPPELNLLGAVRRRELVNSLAGSAAIGLSPNEHAQLLKRRAMDVSLPVPVRAHALDELAGQAITALEAIRRYRPLLPALERERSRSMRTLARLAAPLQD